MMFKTMLTILLIWIAIDLTFITISARTKITDCIDVKCNERIEEILRNDIDTVYDVCCPAVEGLKACEEHMLKVRER